MTTVTYTRKDQKKADRILRKQRAAIYRRAAEEMIEYGMTSRHTFYAVEENETEWILTSPTLSEYYQLVDQNALGKKTGREAFAMCYLLAAEIAEQGQWFD